MAMPLPVFAQGEGESFFDKYLPIAKLFDSPLFFGVVVGSAVVLLLVSLVFLGYVKRMEKRVDEWGKGKSDSELIRLLDSSEVGEARAAFAYLRRHGGENTIAALIDRLQEQRKEGRINPAFIYLFEDLKAADAIPILQLIAKGKSRVAELAERALERIPAPEGSAEKAG